ncbi:MAG: cytochrome b/b6 domain-containing protein [Rhizobiaceae bacterium]
MTSAGAKTGKLIYRQNRWTRITHWVWATSLFFLLLSGLQIFNAHPWLSIGKETGFDYNNSIVKIGSVTEGDIEKGYTEVFGSRFDTSGYLGLHASGGETVAQAFPPALTIPSGRDLGTGRVVHFFFAWVLVITLTIWLIASAFKGRIRGELLPNKQDLKSLPQDIKDHARLRFHHTAKYSVLQKLAYCGVLFVLFPAIIITGLAMSPGFNAFVPFLNDLLGGRQTARTIHFVAMALLVGFFIIHMVMILAAGPINELRSIITGWYRIDAESKSETEN